MAEIKKNITNIRLEERGRRPVLYQLIENVLQNFDFFEGKKDDEGVVDVNSCVVWETSLDKLPVFLVISGQTMADYLAIEEIEGEDLSSAQRVWRIGIGEVQPACRRVSVHTFDDGGRYFQAWKESDQKRVDMTDFFNYKEPLKAAVLFVNFQAPLMWDKDAQLGGFLLRSR